MSADVSQDFDGNLRVQGAGADAGAYERGALSLWAVWKQPTKFGANDGFIRIAPAGGKVPYTVSWADGGSAVERTGLGPGIYRATVRDAAGQSNQRQIALVSPARLVVDTTTKPVVRGTGNNTVLGTASLNITGGTPFASGPTYSVTWGDGASGAVRTNLNAGTYTYRVADAAGAIATGSIFIRDAGRVIRRVNAGGGDIVDSAFPSDALLLWHQDTQSNPDSASLVSSGQTTSGSPKWNGLHSTEAPSEVLGTFRRDAITGQNMKYEFAVPSSGTYELDLYFRAPNADARVFNVSVEGSVALSNFDLPGEAGIDRPIQKTILATVTDGKLTVEFTSTTGEPLVNALEVHDTGAVARYRINNGGVDEPGPDIGWKGDKQTAPSPYLVTTGQLTTGPNVWNSGGSNRTDAPDNLFGNLRYDPIGGQEMAWKFPVPAGTYRVDLYFIERNETVTQAGQHQFNVALEGALVLTNYDVFARYGFMKPARESLDVTITDGTLDLSFSHVPGAGNPMVSGIAISRLN